MTSSIHIGIVADDLTGANDTAVQFGTRGWDARIALDEDATLTGQVVAVSSDARPLAEGPAAAATEAAIERLNPTRLYLKIDSTARGSIAAQVTGALGAWQRRYPDAVAVVCPAYPAMARTVEAGEVRVAGIPVHRTAIGTDPVTPVTESSLVARIPNARSATIDEVGSAAPGEILVLDARSPAQLDQFAIRLAELGERVIVVGSAGFAESLARHLPGDRDVVDAPRPSGRSVILLSSLNPVSHAQADALTSFAPDQVRVVTPSGADLGGTTPQAEGDGGVPPAPITLIRTPQDRVAEGDGSAAAAVADALAAVTVSIIEREHPAVVGLVGGDGARAVLRRLGAVALAVRDAAVEGAPLMTIVGGPHDGLPVWTKAGGFGEPDALLRILEHTGALAAPTASPSVKEDTP